MYLSIRVPLSLPAPSNLPMWNGINTRMDIQSTKKYLVSLCKESDIITKGAQILNIQIYNLFQNRTFWCSYLRWFSIRIIRTLATAIAIVLTIRKQNQHIGIQNGGYLVRFGMFGLFSFGMLQWGATEAIRLCQGLFCLTFLVLGVRC